MSYATLPIAVHIILQQNTQIFLLKRCGTGYKDGLWSLPAGRLEKHESLTQAAIREANEEAGVNIKASDLSEPLVMHHHDDRGERIYVFFMCGAWDGEPRNMEPDKCSEARWFQYTELPMEIIEHVKEAIHAIQAGKRYMEYGFGE